MIKSRVKIGESIQLPLVEEELSMVPFNLVTLVGLPLKFVSLVKTMLKGVSVSDTTAYFTLHGKKLKRGDTLRRGAPHTDGNYEPIQMTFGGGGGGGWKVGETGPKVGTALHERQYLKETGGIIIASNFESSLGWEGTFFGQPSRGGDCSHLTLNTPFILERNKVYRGNNHFIHESLPVGADVHRVMARITLPEDHVFN